MRRIRAVSAASRDPGWPRISADEQTAPRCAMAALGSEPPSRDRGTMPSSPGQSLPPVPLAHELPPRRRHRSRSRQRHRLRARRVLRRSRRGTPRFRADDALRSGELAVAHRRGSARFQAGGLRAGRPRDGAPDAAARAARARIRGARAARRGARSRRVRHGSTRHPRRHVGGEPRARVRAPRAPRRRARAPGALRVLRLQPLGRVHPLVVPQHSRADPYDDVGLQLGARRARAVDAHDPVARGRRDARRRHRLRARPGDPRGRASSTTGRAALRVRSIARATAT